VSLGELGQARAPSEETFGWFGTQMRVHPDLSDAAMVDAADAAETITDLDGAAALRLVKKFLREVVHPEDFDQFWTIGRANRQSVEDFSTVAATLIEAVTGRPTQRPAGSSAGPGATAPNFADDSYSRVMRRLDGRPDLQLMVLEARESRAS
jgi:hypothetical protein